MKLKFLIKKQQLNKFFSLLAILIPALIIPTGSLYAQSKKDTMKGVCTGLGGTFVDKGKWYCCRPAGGGIDQVCNDKVCGDGNCDTGTIVDHGPAETSSESVVGAVGTDWESRSKLVQKHGLSFGDFDGDGNQEVFFRTTGGKWGIAEEVFEPEKKINASNVPFSQLAFGDFNGDGKTDVFKSGGEGKWWVSFSGTGKWQQLNVSSIPLSGLAFGDFNGDGKTDVFKSGGQGKWWVSFSGTDKWQQLNVSSIPLSGLAFGDFNGDGKTDVFKSGGQGKWWVSFSGTGKWQQLNVSSIPLSHLRFADVDKDGSTDILSFKQGEGIWLVSFGGKTKLERSTYRQSHIEDQRSVRLGDWDGDSKPDSFAYFR